MAATCARTNSSEWTVKAIDAPSTAGHCCIDLVHNSTALDFSLVSPQGRPDVFGPFIRVTNSYNGLRALVFDIGFFRKVCTNGLILRDAIIQLPRGLGLKLARAMRGTEKEPMMSLDVFMNDTCPKCRKLIKLTAVEPHPTNRELAVHKLEGASCRPVTSKILYRKLSVATS
jgi:hypothetical protein